MNIPKMPRPWSPPVLALAMLILGACGSPPAGDACVTNDDCFVNEICVNARCEASTTLSDAGFDANATGNNNAGGEDTGENHSCGLRVDGSVRCWGYDEHGRTTPPPGARFKQISAGKYHNCGITNGGGVRCWGWHGDQATSPPGGVDFVEVGAGDGHSCARRQDNTVVCWGSDVEGQARAPDYTDFEHISLGSVYTCGLRGGVIHCWGSADHGVFDAPRP